MESIAERIVLQMNRELIHRFILTVLPQVLGYVRVVDPDSNTRNRLFKAEENSLNIRGLFNKTLKEVII